jgi:hypothetical protein
MSGLPANLSNSGEPITPEQREAILEAERKERLKDLILAFLDEPRSESKPPKKNEESL